MPHCVWALGIGSCGSIPLPRNEACMLDSSSTHGFQHPLFFSFETMVLGALMIRMRSVSPGGSLKVRFLKIRSFVCNSSGYQEKGFKCDEWQGVILFCFILDSTCPKTAANGPSLPF